MTVNTAAGSRLFIGTTAGDSNNTLADYEADSYVEVGEVEDLGQFGDQSQTITFATLKDGRVRKFKGPRDAGDMAVVCGADSSDDGQAAAIAAEATPFAYNIKVMLNDALTISGTPTTIYFRAKVMSKRRNVGNVSNVVKYDFTLAVDSALTEVAAT